MCVNKWLVFNWIVRDTWNYFNFVELSWTGLVPFSMFNGISTLFGLFNAKAILLEEQSYLTHSWEDKGVHTFPKGICPKLNVIARLENELAYYDFAVHRFNHYTTRTPTLNFCLVYLFNGISTLFRLFNAKAILLEEQ